MEELKQMSQAVTLRPKNIYGLRTDVKGNIHFNLNQEVIYPVEAVLAFHDYVHNKQRFLRLPEDTEPLIIALSPHRRLLAVFEVTANVSASIAVYDLQTLKKRRAIPLPPDVDFQNVAEMSFSIDNRAILLLTKPPEEIFFMLIMDKSDTVIENRPTTSITRGSVECFATNVQDHNLIAIGGDEILQLINKSEKGFTVANNVKINFHCKSMIFLQADLLLIGTSQNELILVENGEVRTRQLAREAEVFDILWDQEALDRELEKDHNRYINEEKLYDKNVVCMTFFPRGFAFAIFNRVYVFERVSKFKFERKTVLTVPISLYAEHLYQITNLAIDHKQETVIVTTKHSQIYVGILIVPETLKVKFLKFEPLGEMIHIGDIVDASVCMWKPIIMTASRDQSVRIWNYETDKLELVRKFQVDVNIVELSSTGLMAAIAFTDQLRIVQIFLDELNVVKTYNFPGCMDVRYSNLGHMMAAAYDNNLIITSVFNLDVVRNLKGHNGTVLSVAWTSNDKYLISGGAEGAIYQWDIETGTRIQEIVQKGTEYLTVCVTSSDPLTIYAATQHGTIREFQNSEIVREVTPPTKIKSSLTHMCLSRSDMIMFVANERGDLYNVRLPMMDAGGQGPCTNMRFFTNRINKLLFSYDGTLLVAISKNGTLSVWAMENIEGKIAPLDQDLLRSQEVLIPRSVLYEKNEQIANLEVRLKQQAEEFQYQLSQNEIFDGQQLAEVHKSYCQALEELKQKNNEIEERHTEEMNQITFQINGIKEDHRKQLDQLANQFSERMLIEYQKFSNLRENMLQLRESYENKLKMSAGTLQDTVEGLEADYKKQLDERRELIRELMKEMQDKKVEFIEYCRGVEVENDRNMVDMQIQYENKLTAEREQTVQWRGRAGVLQKRYETLNKEMEFLLEEVETLKEEHNKSQRSIQKLNNNIDDLQKDISDRDYAISAKEKRIQDLLHKNQELDKYKQVLSHKIAELKAQIEPKEFQINDKRKHILEMENELAGLNQNNKQLELQLKELKDKYISNLSELKIERHRARASRECMQSICTEIYEVAGKINSPTELKLAVKNLFERHASDNELKRFISHDAEVRDEFQRQRAQIERVLQMYKDRAEDKQQKRKYDKLFAENVILLEEIEKEREENKRLRSLCKKAKTRKIMVIEKKSSESLTTSIEK